MKKVFWILTIVLVTLFTGCKQNNTNKFENPQQQAFDDFLAVKKKSSFRQNNYIQEKKFLNHFEKELFNYIDSVGLFINWQGVINDIQTEQVDRTTVLMFTISYQPEQYREVVFHCSHLINTDSLDNDYIYKVVENMQNNMVVYFDGFIRTTINNEVDYHLKSAGDDLNIAYPNYQFWILDISSERRDNALSESMNNAVELAYNINKPLKNQYLGLITKKESDRQFNELLPAFNQAKSVLTDREKLYIKRLNTCLIYNYLYGNN